MKLASILLTSLAAGVGGYLLENAVAGPRRSAYVPDGVPFLPVYAVGGAAIMVTEPHVRGLGAVEQMAAYGFVLTGLEAVAGWVDSHEGRQSWDYGGGKRVDLPHSIAWGVLGYGVGQVIGKVSK